MAERVKTRSYNSSRRREQAAATRRDILGAAQRLFERQGYAATTMAAIAAEAGVALKTVYLAFETKSGVLLRG
jgi:AcrR family transcriptional regulator